MRVLFLDAYFNPEITADTHLENDLIDALIGAGDTVSVICPVPTRGVDRETVIRYARIRSESLRDGKIRVIRFWAPQEGKNPLLRAFRYFWCSLRQYWIGIRITDADAIYAISTPPTQGLLAALVSRKLAKRKGRSVPCVYYLEDVFPDTLRDAGMTKEGSPLWKIGRRIEDYTYRNVSSIVTLSDSVTENIIRKGADANKISVVPSWIDSDAIRYVPRKGNRVLKKYGIDPEGFYLVYAGNLGEAQNVNLILDAALILRDSLPVRFLLFGSGGSEESVRSRISEENMENVSLFPLQSQELVADVYSLGNAGIVTCKKGFGQSALPSKTWSILSCARPVLASFDYDSEMHAILDRNGCGLLSDADDAQGFADAVRRFYGMTETEREAMGKAGRAYVEEHRDRKRCTEKLVNLIHTAQKPSSIKRRKET